MSRFLKIKWSRYIPHAPTAKQLAFISLPHEEGLYGGAAGGGKGLDRNAPVLTPWGWRPIGELKVGDKICATDGTVTTVIGVYPHENLACYKLTWHDGSSTICDENHIWLGWITGKSRKIGNERIHGESSAKKWTMKQLIDWYENQSTNRKQRFAIPVISSPTAFNVHGENKGPNLHISRSIPPYILGVTLGDGWCNDTQTAFCSADKEIADKVSSLCGEQIKPYKSTLNKKCRVYPIRQFKKDLELLGLKNCRAWEKFIPRIYKYATVEERQELVRGLMDTDGWADQDGDCYYCSTSKRLAKDMAEVCRSLGCIVSIRHGIKKCNGEPKRQAYTLRIKTRNAKDLFSLSRKKELARESIQSMGLYLKSIKKVASRPTTCIQVSHPNSLFITKDYVVTHNSDALLMLLLQYFDCPGYKGIIFRRKLTDHKLPSSVLSRAKEWLAPFIDRKEVKYVPGEHTMYSKEGGVITFGYLDKEGSKERYQCFHPETELLTKSGWKKIKDAQVGELAATMNPETRIMEYKPISATQEYDYDGTVYSKKSKTMDFTVTDNHEMLYTKGRYDSRLKRSQAKHLPDVFCLPQWNYWEGTTPSPKSFTSAGKNGKTVSFGPKEWAEFLGWYIAEGCTSKSRYSIQISQTDLIGRTLIRDLLNRCNVNFWEQPKQFSFGNKALLEWLDDHCGKGAFNKKIPDEVKEWDSAHIEILLRALVQADGTWRDNNGHFVTSSDQLADDVCELAVKAGYRPTKTWREYKAGDGTYPTTKTGIWHVSLNYQSGRDTLAYQKTINQSEHTKFKASHYKGKVYCVTVPPYHTILTRKGGKILWTGQSSEYSTICYDEVTHFLEDEYLYLFSRLRRTIAANQTYRFPLRMRAATNPGGRGGPWVKRRWGIYQDPDGEFRGHDPQRPFIQAKVRDNPHLDGKEYERALAKLDPVTRDRLRDGDWSASENALFKDYWFENRYTIKGDFINYKSGDKLKTFHKNQLFYFTAIDSASSEKSGPEGRVFYVNQEPCWSVCGTFALTPDHDLLWWDNWRGQVEIPRFVQSVIEVHKAHKPAFALVESNSIGQGVFQTLRAKGLNVVPVPSTSDKIVRSAAGQIRSEAGKIVLPAYADWLPDLEDELFVWTGLRGETDDQIDVLSLAASYASHRAVGSEVESGTTGGHTSRPVARGGLWTPPSRKIAVPLHRHLLGR